MRQMAEVHTRTCLRVPNPYSRHRLGLLKERRASYRSGAAWSTRPAAKSLSLRRPYRHTSCCPCPLRDARRDLFDRNNLVYELSEQLCELLSLLVLGFHPPSSVDFFGRSLVRRQSHKDVQQIGPRRVERDAKCVVIVVPNR